MILSICFAVLQSAICGAHDINLFRYVVSCWYSICHIWDLLGNGSCNYELALLDLSTPGGSSFLPVPWHCWHFFVVIVVMRYKLPQLTFVLGLLYCSKQPSSGWNNSLISLSCQLKANQRWFCCCCGWLVGLGFVFFFLEDNSPISFEISVEIFSGHMLHLFGANRIWNSVVVLLNKSFQ